MTFSLEYYLIGIAALLLLSVTASKLSDRLGIPSLLIFLIIGMLAGSDGPGGIYFDNPTLAQYIGVIALAVILFSGGLDTNWMCIRIVLWEGIVLATVGVLITAVTVGILAHFILHLEFLESLLIGAIVSSTDAAAVFAILRSKGVQLKGRLRPLLEFESGSNDPMAVFLTIGLIQLITHPSDAPIQLLPLFFTQMLIGGVTGILAGKAGLFLINRLRLGYEGLYPVLSFALVFLAYGSATLLSGSGFLAVYLAGVVMGQKDFLHKRSLIRFYDGIAWLMQILMFLTLGLLVFPSRLVPVIFPALFVALVLIIIARPLGVFISLLPSRFKPREKLFLSWVGLRGAVPIVLATYPYLAGVKNADLIFNVIFFVVLTSVLFQGTTIPFAAKRLGVQSSEPPAKPYPIELMPGGGVRGEMKEIMIPKDSPFEGKAIFELGLPEDYLVILIGRDDEYIIPNGGTLLRTRDVLISLTSQEAFQQVLDRVVVQDRKMLADRK